jgi:hypothetical protein
MPPPSPKRKLTRADVFYILDGSAPTKDMATTLSVSLPTVKQVRCGYIYKDYCTDYHRLHGAHSKKYATRRALTQEQVQGIYAGGTTTAWAASYGISDESVRRIRMGKLYKDWHDLYHKGRTK